MSNPNVSFPNAVPDDEFVSLAQQAAIDAQVSADAAAVALAAMQAMLANYLYYDVAGYYPGSMANGATFLHFVAPLAFTIPINAAGSKGNGIIAAAASTTMNIQKNGSNVGTLNFAIGANNCTFTVAAPVSFVAGDRLTIAGPAVADASLANISIVIRGALP